MKECRITNILFSSGLAVLLLLGFINPAAASEIEMADSVLIKKSERKLYLLKNGRTIKSMDIALGLVPEGDKQTEGDFRTPEGRYELTERNPASDFFLSILISYPDDREVRRARSLGIDPGGQIMIHGMPNELKYSPDYYRWTDWTDGCIAVSNSNMVDIWLMTDKNTPIEIVP
jgi:murein L,D-transpeptidase YafK